MSEFDFQGVQYRSSPLDADVQLGILRRLLPAVIAVGTHAGNLMAVFDAFQRWVGEGGAAKDKSGDMFSLVEKAAISVQPAAEQLAKLTDDDIAYITNHCLSVTRRVKPDGGVFDPIRSKTGVIQNKDDGRLPVRLAIAWAVIRADLGSMIAGFMSGQAPDIGGSA